MLYCCLFIFRILLSNTRVALKPRGLGQGVLPWGSRATRMAKSLWALDPLREEGREARCSLGHRVSAGATNTCKGTGQRWVCVCSFAWAAAGHCSAKEAGGDLEHTLAYRASE